MFSAYEIADNMGLKPAISSELFERIQLWNDMYSGAAPWLDGETVSLRLEQGIVREFANIVLNEMTVSVSNEKLDGIFQAALRNMNENLQSGLATGAMIIKPVSTDKVQFVSQSSFVPIEYDGTRRLTKVIFPETKQSGNTFYTRLEYHSLTPDKGLEIINRAYKSRSENSIGRQIPLDEVEEWAALPEYIAYPMMKRPAFGYYRNPIKNTVDSGFGGISIFESAVDMIRCADEQFGRLDWEFESGKRIIHVSEDMVKKMNDGTLDIKMKRLYRGLDADGNDLYHEYSPALRQSDISAGLDEYKRLIEFQTCLAYGDISNPQDVEKTATEVLTAKKRKYNMVSAIQRNLYDCLDDLAYAIAFYNSMATVPYTFNCEFSDSILGDDESERAQDREDVANGTLSPAEYRAKWRGETLEQAAAAIEKIKAENPSIKDIIGE